MDRGKRLLARCFHVVNLRDFITVVVDNFDGDFACRRWIKGAARGGIKSGPRSLVDFRTQSAFQFLVGLIGSREVGMADKEALVLHLKSPFAALYRPFSFDFLAPRESEKE